MENIEHEIHLMIAKINQQSFDENISPYDNHNYLNILHVLLKIIDQLKKAKS